MKGLYLFFLLTVTYLPVQGMSHQNIAAGIGYVLASNRLIKESIAQFVSTDHLLRQQEPNKSVNDFLRSYIPATGYNQPIHIRTYFWLDGPSMASMKDNIVLISNYAHKEIDALLNNRSGEVSNIELLDIQRKLDGYGALFQHEIGHLKNKDHQKAFYQSFVATVATLGISKLLNHLLCNKQVNSYSGNILWGLGIAAGNYLIIKMMNKNTELQADASIPYNKQVLEGFHSLLEWLDEREQLAINTIGTNNSPLVAQLKRKAITTLVDCIEDHPSYKIRLRHVQKRLENKI